MCLDVGNYVRHTFYLAATILIIIILLKISTGVSVLLKMKKNLNFYYLSQRWEIRLTIVLTCFITLWKSMYNFYNLIRDVDLKYSFLARSTTEPYSLTYQIPVCLIDIFAPMLVMVVNIRTVNFVKYLISLMKG